MIFLTQLLKKKLCTKYSTNSSLCQSSTDKVNDHRDCESSHLAAVKKETFRLAPKFCSYTCGGKVFWVTVTEA